MNRAQKILLLLMQRVHYLLRDDFEGPAGVPKPGFWTVPDTYATTELVTNGTFAANITGWTNASIGTGSIAWNAGGYMDIINGGGANTGVARQSIITIAGLSYTLTFVVGVGNLTLNIGTSAGGQQIQSSTVYSTGSKSVIFTATTAATWFDFANITDSATHTLDTVSVLPNQGLIYVSGGNLGFYGGYATPAWAGPAAVSVKSWPRQAGLTIEWEVTPGAANKEQLVGFTDGSLASNAAEAHGIYLKDTGIISVIVNAATGIVTPLAYTAASLWAKIVVLATGAVYYISTDNRVTWYPIWKNSTVTTTPLYAFIESYNAALTSASVKVWNGYAKPAVINATASAVTLAYGSELVVNGTFDADSNWTKEDTWVIGSGVASHSTGTGTTYLTAQASNPVIGTWYLVHYVGTRSAGNYGLIFGGVDTGTKGGAATVDIVVRATSTVGPKVYGTAAYVGTIDNVSALPSTFSSMLTGGGDAGFKYGTFDADVTVAADLHGGVVCCLDSATTPLYYLYAYVDRFDGNVHALKVVNGTPSAIITAGAVTYGASKKVRIVVSPGTSGLTNAQIGVYYGTAGSEALIGAVATVDLSSYGTLVRGFTTDAAATLVIEANV